jgi:hypothetical protein
LVGKKCQKGTAQIQEPLRSFGITSEHCEEV